MATTLPIPAMEQLSNDPEAETTGMRDADPDFALEEAEEEEYAELWASDPGNQGA